MEMKILLIPEGDGSWHWFLQKYDDKLKIWYTTRNGLEKSFEKAAVEAKFEYDELAKKNN